MIFTVFTIFYLRTGGVPQRVIEALILRAILVYFKARFKGRARSAETENEIVSNAMEVKARGGYIIGINHENNEVFDFFIKVPDVGDLNPVTQIIPIQILSYQLAVMRGADPDKPRNLAKSVTVK